MMFKIVISNFNESGSVKVCVVVCFWFVVRNLVWYRLGNVIVYYVKIYFWYF